jgi:hypothetical protein
LCACILAACTNPATYQPEGDKGFLAMGVAGQEDDYQFAIARVSPATGQQLEYAPITLARGNEASRSKGKMVLHLLVPGSYRLTLFTFRLGHPMNPDCRGRLEFTIKPGVVNYIGDVLFDRHAGPQITGQNPDIVSEYLASEIPDLNFPVESIPVRTFFHPGSGCLG